VKQVKLELSDKRAEIEPARTEGAKAKCPVCGQDCTLYDYAPERTGRHLDTMPFETILRVRVPRVDCATDGVKTVAVPWAEPGGRFTRGCSKAVCSNPQTTASHGRPRPTAWGIRRTCACIG
jgi:transposase